MVRIVSGCRGCFLETAVLDKRFSSRKTHDNLASLKQFQVFNVRYLVITAPMASYVIGDA